MKIWIDLTNSPHVNFFKSLIDDWKADGHEIIITCRDLSNTIDLINQNGWEFLEVGGHAGANLTSKLLYFPKRVRLLSKRLRGLKPDVAISHSSFYSPVAASLLGIPSVYINDNEHAKGNYIAFLFANAVYMPEALEELSKKKKWRWRAKHYFYPGIKEGIYLSRSGLTRDKLTKNSGSRLKMFVRPEPWTAQYYKGKKFFFDQFLKDVSVKYDIYILPRSKEQEKHFKHNLKHSVKVQKKPLSLSTIVRDCDVFIGAGGSMTREMALMNIPTISIYQDELLEVDKFLIRQNNMLHEPDVSAEILDKLADKKNAPSTELMEKGVQAYQMIKESIFKL